MRRLPVALLLGALALPQPARALSVNISRFDDPSPAPRQCTERPVDCSLRGAVEEVEGNSLIDRTIAVPPGFYQLKSLILLGDLTLAGRDALTTIIDASAANDRVFVIFPDSTVAITGVTMAHGAVLGSGEGGAIDNVQGTLTLTDCIVRDSVSDEAGGGISSTGPLTLVRTVVSGNRSAGLGGGVFNHGSTLTAIDSTIDGNQSFITGVGGANAGGLANTGSAVLTGCTISNNGAGTSGGGLANFGTTMTLTNCTVSGNTAGADPGVHDKIGGGIQASGSGLITLNNVTVTDNTASAGGGIVADSGGINAQNSIIAGNHGDNPDCQGTLTSLGYDLVGSTTGCTIAGSSVNLTDLDPLLGPLADNGGPTRTHALVAGSPAIDAGHPAAPGTDVRACADADQRGVDRPQPAGGRCDVGAFEVRVPTTTTTTLPPTEICGDCIDNDGNGLTDLEDPACCTAGAATLRLRDSRLTPGHGSTKLALVATLAPFPGPIVPRDVLIQMRADGQPDFLCVRIPADHLVRRGARQTFKDPTHAVVTAHGVDALRLVQKKKRSLALQARGGRIALSLPSAGMLHVSAGTIDPATGAGDRCGTVAVPFKGVRNGALEYP